MRMKTNSPQSPWVGTKFNDAAHGGEHQVVSVSRNRFGSLVLRACLCGKFGGWGTYADYTVEFVSANKI